MNITKDTIKELSTNLNEPKWLLEKRLDAFEQQSELGLQKYGIGIFADYSALEIEEQDFSISGVQLKADGAQVKHFDSAAKDAKYAKYLKKYMQPHFVSPFAQAAVGMFTDGFVVHITKETEEEEIEMILSQKVKNSHTYILVIVDENVSISLREMIDVQNIHNVVIEIIVKKGASCKYTVVQNSSLESSLFVSRKSYVQAQANFDVVDIELGGGYVQSYIYNQLEGEAAQGTVSGLFLAHHQQQFDINTISHHTAPTTQSDILVKGVLDGESKAIYRGLVKIDKEAKQSVGYQKEDTLMLSKNAEISSVPDLEIETNEVQCSHGVTTSRIDKEKLFYFVSRGYSETDARKAFIDGHVSPIIEKIDNESLKNDILELLNKRVLTN